VIIADKTIQHETKLEISGLPMEMAYKVSSESIKSSWKRKNKTCRYRTQKDDDYAVAFTNKQR
jgi:hypothetical protein